MMLGKPGFFLLLAAPVLASMAGKPNGAENSMDVGIPIYGFIFSEV
jgi:hypothetical protein